MFATYNATTALTAASSRPLLRCPGSIVKAHTFDVTSCARGLGVRHSILTPVGGSEFEFEERCELARDSLPALTFPRSATPIASGFGPMLRMAAWMVYYAD